MRMKQLLLAFWICSVHTRRVHVPAHERTSQPNRHTGAPNPTKELVNVLFGFNPAIGQQSVGACKHSAARARASQLHMQVTNRLEKLLRLGASDTVPLGNLRIPKMGMGTLNWPLDKTSDPDSAAALEACLGSGVNFFDTAEAYGFGKSEELLRDCVAKVDAPVVLATKFAPVPWRQRPEDVVAAARASAARLGVDSIDLYQIHFPDIIQPFKPFGFELRKDEEYWDGIAMAYHKGVIKNVGVSNYSPKLLQRAINHLADREVPVASNQINYSLLYRKQSQPVVDFCRERGITVLGYFPLANGLLTGKYSAENLPKGRKGFFMKKYIIGGVTQGGVEYPKGGVTDLVATMQGIANAREKTVAQIALNYVITKGVVPIPGCRDAKMATDNCGALGWSLTSGEINALERAADSIGFEYSSGGFSLEDDEPTVG